MVAKTIAYLRVSNANQMRTCTQIMALLANGSTHFVASRYGTTYANLSR